MCIRFHAINQSDAVFLADVLKKSFDSDSELAFGKGVKLGPPGYDDGTLCEKILQDTSLQKLIISYKQENCGILVYKDGEPSTISYFCLDPRFIGQGIGTRTWKAFEVNKKGIWQVETPDFSLRNHHFYQKLGFKQIGEKSYGDQSKSFLFVKHL
ncbi:GNAT family N-acetyltransferase [Enterococcus sp. DIV0876]|uniref:GNAT family N-acetyltransferase n=1 Tax=Enterococcus sp. DIV0876 TaxID=2774633 RepID=UPI003D2FC617